MTEAQLLQCPDCSHRHDLSALGAVATFECAGCGRPLKVPAVVRVTAVAGPTPASSDTSDTSVTPTVTPPVSKPTTNPGRRAAAGAAAGPVRIRLWIRLAIWLFAVPFGMLVVFGIAGKMGVITFDELLKTFTASGWDRFAPIAKILPVAAFLIAVIVQAAVTGLERREKNIRAALLTTSAGTDRLEARNVG